MRGLKDIIKTDPVHGIYQLIHGNLAKEMAPFSLFDAVSTKTDDKWGFSWHPHSGVSTLTYVYGADLCHEDSNHGKGRVKQGGFQWMQAGGGIFHKEFLDPIDGHVGAHQLWVQLPPSLEEEDSCYFDKAAADIPSVDNVKIIVGEYQGTKVDLGIPADMTYFDVALKDGESITLPIPEQQTRGILLAREGSLEIGEHKLHTNELGLLEEVPGDITVIAKGNTQFIIATIVPSPYPVVTSRGQVHTSQEALDRSFERIQKIKPRIPFEPKTGIVT